VKLLLFDIDQTLVNTGGAGLRALDRACQKLYGLQNAMDGVRPHGKTDPAIVREILRVKLSSNSATDGEIATVLEGYVSFLKEEVRTSPTYRVLPGIVPLLNEMATRSDIVLGLATGNVELGARIKLERAELNSFFAFGGFGSDSEDRTELVRKGAEKANLKIGHSIPPSEVFVIGDTPLDIQAGNRSGFKTVGVATGTYTVDQLLAAGATFAVEDLAQGRDYFLRSTFIE
jgi:phosphoglycolate phosphatase-like HAD superfamily hydrolase